MRVLVVRPDRIGDVVLSTPVFGFLKEAIPGCSVEVLVRKQVAPVLKCHPHVDEVLPFDPQRDSGAKLARNWKARGYDAAIVLQVSARTTWAVRLASIPLRVGPLSKWYSHLCFNAGLKQNRSSSQKNEAEYNLELAAHAARRLGFGARAGLGPFRSKIVADRSLRPAVESYLGSMGLKGGGFVLLHAGMGGSALNWPRGHYAELLKILSKRGISVALGGDEADQALNAGIAGEALKRGADGKRIHVLKALKLEEYISLMESASVVVAPSTGPLHLAAGLGRPTVSFYPPIRVQSKERWGPFGGGAAAILSPEVVCPQKYECAGTSCVEYYCMARVQPGAVAIEVERLAKNTSA